MQDENDIVFNDMCGNPVYDMMLNGSITESEIIDAITNLKNGKAAGINNFVNEEYFKYSQPKLISIYCKLFNIVFDTGIIPESWLTGIIRPVYKK